MTYSNPQILSSSLPSAQEGSPLDVLLQSISSEDAEVRTEAWRGAWEVGAIAVGPLADLMKSDQVEVARAAKRGIWQIVRHSGRPGGEEERVAVEKELLQLIQKGYPDPTLIEVLWMLSEIGKAESVSALAPLLSNEKLREDARMALERIPGDASLAALQGAFEKCPADFKPNLVQSLRARGVEVSGYPCVKLTPTKQTEIQPIK